MFEGASRGASSVKKITWIGDVRASGNISKECIAYLKEKQVTSCVIGGVGLKRLMPSYQYRLLMDSLRGRKIVDSDRSVERVENGEITGGDSSDSKGGPDGVPSLRFYHRHTLHGTC